MVRLGLNCIRSGLTASVCFNVKSPAFRYYLLIMKPNLTFCFIRRCLLAFPALLRTIFFVFFSLLLANCHNSPSPVLADSSRIKKHVILSPTQIRFKLNFHFLSPSPEIPICVFVFPPLRVNGSGIPTEALSPVFDRKGDVMGWKSPAPKARELKLYIESFFEEKGYRVLSFEDVIETKKDHAILIVSPYYSSAVLLKNSKQTVSLFVSLKGFTFPGDLNPQERKVIFDQGVFVCCQRTDNFKMVMNLAFREAVMNIGKNRSYEDFVIVDR